MYLDLLDVVREPGNFVEKPIDIAAGVVDDIEFLEPIQGTIRAANARRNVVVTGKVHTAIEMECARCLKSYAQVLELELEAFVPIGYFGTYVAGLPERNAEEDNEDELSEEELTALFDGHSLDVLELIRQAVVLQSPRKPLCDSDCAGLPEANQYKNASSDPRWGALKNWKEDHGSA